MLDRKNAVMFCRTSAVEYLLGDNKAVLPKGCFMRVMCFLILTTGALMAADDPSKGDLDKLRGTWVTVSLVNNGKTLVDEKTPPKDGPTTKLAYDGNKWMVRVGDKSVGSGTFRIDPKKTPKEIDILGESGMNEDKTKLGIYELDGDTYRYCLAPAGKPRPTEFASKEGSGHSLGVSQRQKP